MRELKFIDDFSLGGEMNPVSNNIELKEVLTHARNCKIYTKNIFQPNKENSEELVRRNVILVGIAFAFIKNPREYAHIHGGFR